MLNGWVIVGASVAYLGILFAIAFYADRRAAAGRSVIANPMIYSLSLGVYATAWTFYGSVGRAAEDGIGFLPIYIGPTLMIALWWVVVRKIIRISKQNRITSLADFVAARYGKSALLGALVTVIAVIGILPYISLQLKAVYSSFMILMQYPAIVMPSKLATEPVVGDTAFWVALLLGAFTIAFGTRKLDAAEHHEGMVAAVAFESVVKLLAFLAAGAFVTFGMFGGFADIFSQAAGSPGIATKLTPLEGVAGSYASWMWLTILSMLAILFLPRQFQVAVIENVDERHLTRAIWLFPLYMLAINVFVLPIAFGGLLRFSSGAVDADTFVLTLPMAEKQQLLALFVFIGGLSAATSMIIVETIALSTMVCNDLVMPVLLRLPGLKLSERKDLTAWLLTIRRGAILGIVLLGYSYFRLAGEAYALVSIGLISFTAVAQFGPAVLGGLFWKGGTRRGALAGLVAGFVVWLYALVVPAFARSGWLPIELLEHGPLGLELLRPLQLFGLTGLDQTTHAMIWSMMANVGLYISVSLAAAPTVEEHRQATLFVDVFRHSASGGVGGARFWRGTASSPDLFDLLGRFVGVEGAEVIFRDFARARGRQWPDPTLEADAELVHYIETQLAGVIGASSSRIMIASVVKEEAITLEEVRQIVGEASQVVAYSHQLEQKSKELEAATAELRAANERLQELDRLKDDFVSTISHELRTPLTSIRSFSQILREDPNVDLDKRKRFLDIITKEAERLSRLINEILDLSKLESGTTEWNETLVDVRELVEMSVTATSSLFREKGIEVETDIAAFLPRIVTDSDRVLQVLHNLLSNAVKFCVPGRGRVRIRVCAEEDGVRVDVRDDGPGISAADQGVIFDKFRQAEASRHGRPRGTGLGLHISARIVEHFGGRIWVASQPGQGATFSFTLPARGNRLAA